MKIIIAGAGEVGSHLAKMLSGESNDITVIDPEIERLRTLSETADVITVNGNTTSLDVLKYAGADKADLFIAVNPSTSQDVNIVSAMLAKKLGSKKVTARVNNEEYLTYENKPMFSEMGIDLLFYPEKIAAGEIVELLKKNSSTDALDFGRGKLQISAFKLEEESEALDMKLIDFTNSISSEGVQFRVVAISRDGETIMPRFDTKFRYHDVVYLIATREGMSTLMNHLRKEDITVRKLMILGGGKIGEMVAKQISGQMDTLKIIERDRERCLALTEKLGSSVSVVNGDGRNTDMLLEESIKEFDAFVAVTDSSETNILACVAAKNMGVNHTIAQVENLEYIRLAEGMGVDAVINKKLITASRIFKLTLSNKVKFIKYMSGTAAQVLEYVVSPDSKVTKSILKELNFPKDAVIGGIIRGQEAFIAVGDTKIEAYDRVIVFAAPNAVKEVDKFFR